MARFISTQPPKGISLQYMTDCPKGTGTTCLGQIYFHPAPQGDFFAVRDCLSRGLQREKTQATRQPIPARFDSPQPPKGISIRYGAINPVPARPIKSSYVIRRSETKVLKSSLCFLHNLFYRTCFFVTALAKEKDASAAPKKSPTPPRH